MGPGAHHFTEMVDEMVRSSESDPELASGIRWLDMQAQERGVTLYDMVFEALYRHDVTARARTWLSSRN